MGQSSAFTEIAIQPYIAQFQPYPQPSSFAPPPVYLDPFSGIDSSSQTQVDLKEPNNATDEMIVEKENDDLSLSLSLKLWDCNVSLSIFLDSNFSLISI